MDPTSDIVSVFCAACVEMSSSATDEDFSKVLADNHGTSSLQEVSVGLACIMGDNSNSALQVTRRRCKLVALRTHSTSLWTQLWFHRDCEYWDFLASLSQAKATTATRRELVDSKLSDLLEDFSCYFKPTIIPDTDPEMVTGPNRACEEYQDRCQPTHTAAFDECGIYPYVYTNDA
ncbi:uncharacterized protein TRAVEDRAFT_23401 [Trametes versicolor FP-101664 SS1]|uniref:uncharacterized protein n=1 Tax=Trametes versicolor (strain FP-101664) TaxID=717944 RepID=UPI00046226BE|nr:uncharacterized protein TRAVEDRAFT_23401 [Trametes versicolor FP-101664 SS1]EIW54268.1 hypothetical protein TRAVEDRAFT_23401 [Trametes versicolor FP-101664 SS1]